MIEDFPRFLKILSIFILNIDNNLFLIMKGDDALYEKGIKEVKMPCMLERNQSSKGEADRYLIHLKRVSPLDG